MRSARWLRRSGARASPSSPCSHSPRTNRSAVQPALRPPSDRIQRRLQSPPALGEFIEDPHRRSRLDPSFDEPRLLELAQAFAQQAIGDTGYGRRDLGKTKRTPLEDA